ncbi:hypothetical protein [Herbidospora cretacea]|uniref:hypothetical protein n=1 Tax=Herbidospora cretacea TaxID=28444 RepID=UPI000773BE72|nr:hypothetical protein [Herbidospora cretacea]
MNPVLLQEIIHDARPISDVAVGREGEIFTGDLPDDQPLSRVRGCAFGVAAPEDDARYAASHMPRNTVFADRGWLYSIQTGRGRAYTLFAYFDGHGYQVSVVAPRLDGFVGAHLCPDGRIRINAELGSLEVAYARSVLWAAGMDAVLAGYAFPF